METIKCTFIKNESHDDKTGLSISLFKVIYPSKIEMPDGKQYSEFLAKGIDLPCNPGTVNLSGYFAKYKRSYIFIVSEVETILPKDKYNIIKYLSQLKGVSKSSAINMYELFGYNIFNVITDNKASLQNIKGIDVKKANTIHDDFIIKHYAHSLYSYLTSFHVTKSDVIRVYKSLGMKSLDIIRSNPYLLCEYFGIPFAICEKIAEKEHISKDIYSRYSSAIIEVLLQSENGGKLFSETTKFPSFCYSKGFLSKKLYDLMIENDINVTGNTCLPYEICYLMFLKLTRQPVTEKQFLNLAVRLHLEKVIFLNKRDSTTYFYLLDTAKTEYKTALLITNLLNYNLTKIKNLAGKVYDSEKALGMKLSDEQTSAIKMALSNSVSIITGGPGTGKTSVQQGIIKTFQAEFPDKEILLIAPTGRAAKRMSESTGLPASTIHKAVRLTAENEYNDSLDEDFYFNAGLIIVDEASMVGSFLIKKLLSHISYGTRLVIVGDIDQLPSIEVGSVLKELIESHRIPLTRLNKTFRQASGSRISINCARIKVNETHFDYGDDFIFIESSTSKDISDQIVEMFPALIKEYGEDNVVCLTAYKKTTESGVNALNQRLRSVVRGTIPEDTPFFKNKGLKFYSGDKIMFTKNTEELTNGEIGNILDIKYINNLLEIKCNFSGLEITLTEEDLPYIELAYAMTVHKSQGSEYKCVVMAVDEAHKKLLSKAIFYTAISRAKQTIYLVGHKNALIDSIKTTNKITENNRYSGLGHRLNENLKQ